MFLVHVSQKGGRGGALTIFCFPRDILRTLLVKRMVLARQIGTNPRRCPIVFGACISKGGGGGGFTSELVSTRYLENGCS